MGSNRETPSGSQRPSCNDDFRKSQATQESLRKSTASKGSKGQSSKGFRSVLRRTRSKLHTLVSLNNSNAPSNDHVPVSRKRISTVQRGAPLSKLRQSAT